MSVVQPTHCGSAPEKGLSLSTMINIADAVLAEGLASEAEVRGHSRRLSNPPL